MAKEFLVNGLSRTTRSNSRSWRDTRSVIKLACMIVHETRGPIGQFEWYRDNKILLPPQAEMFEVVFFVCLFNCGSK